MIPRSREATKSCEKTVTLPWFEFLQASQQQWARCFSPVLEQYDMSELIFAAPRLYGKKCVGLIHKRQLCCCQAPFNSSPPGQNGRRFADDKFTHIFLNKNIIISIQITQNLSMGPIDNKSGNDLAPTRRQAIIWMNQCWPDSLTHICVIGEVS